MTVLLAEVRRNYAANPAMHIDAAGWGLWAGPGGGAGFSTGVDAATPAGGGGYLRTTWSTGTTSANGGVGYATTNRAPYQILCAPGQLITVSMYVRPSKAQTLYVSPYFLDSANSTLAVYSSGAAAVPGGVWTRLSWSGVVPTGAASMQVVCYASSVFGGTAWNAGDTLDVTGLLVEFNTGSLGGYFDGFTAPANGFSYNWAGQPNASASVAYVVTGTVVAPAAFTPTASVTWGLGDYDSPTLQFNGWDGAGVEWICETPDGWNKSAASTPVVEGGGDGGWFGVGRRTARTLTLRGAFRCADPTQMEAAAQRLRAALEHYREDTTLWHTPTPTGAAAKQMTVRLTGDVSVDDVIGNPRVRTFSAVLSAADPLKYAAGSSGLVSYTLSLPQSSGSYGLSFPVPFPANFGGLTVNAGRVGAVNVGTQPVWPLVTYTGPVDTPTLRHLDLGVAEGIARVLTAYGSGVVDHRVRSVTVAGQSSFFARLPGSTFFPILPGVNSLSFTANAFNPMASCLLSYRPAWS